MINEGRCWMCLHGRLTQKIKMHGIHSDLIIWIQNWLTHRIQKVVVEGCYSGQRSATGRSAGICAGTSVVCVIHDAKLLDLRTVGTAIKVYSGILISYRNGLRNGRWSLTRASVKCCNLGGGTQFMARPLTTFMHRGILGSKSTALENGKVSRYSGKECLSSFVRALSIRVRKS